MGFLRPRSKDAQIADIGIEGEMVTNQVTSICEFFRPFTESVIRLFDQFKNSLKVIEQRYKELGNIRFHEGAVAGLFIVCIFLWLFRKPGFVRGWAEVITDM